MKKLAVLGCGAQSQIFCLNAPKHLGNDYFVTSVCAKNHEHAVELANRVGGRAAYTVDDMLELAPDIVVEFAGIEAVETYAEEILEAGADLIISSVGALDDEKFRDHLVRVGPPIRKKDLHHQRRNRRYGPNGNLCCRRQSQGTDRKY